MIIVRCSVVSEVVVAAVGSRLICVWQQQQQLGSVDKVFIDTDTHISQDTGCQALILSCSSTNVTTLYNIISWYLTYLYLCNAVMK